MKEYKANIEKLTVNNTFYRKVLYTTPQTQLVLMSIPTGEEIGEEVHPHTTQFIRVEEGTGVAYVSGRQRKLKNGDVLIVPPNSKHNIISTDNIKIYTLYSPPEHDKNCIQRIKKSTEC